MKTRSAYSLVCALALLALVATAGPAAAGGGPVYTAAERTGCGESLSDYPQFAQAGETGCLIPGLREGLVPQGLCWLPEQDVLLFCGYRTDGGASALIASDRRTGEIAAQASLLNVDGSPYTGHAGGVCAAGNYIYISNNHLLYRLPLERLLDCPDGTCAFDAEIPVPVNSSFCFSSDHRLYVGEFEYGDSYHTDSSHRVKTADGTYRAWICAYDLSADGTLAPDTAPAFIFAVSERIQGMAVKDGTIYLSRSYGRKNSSSILRYTWNDTDAPDASVSFMGRDIPVYCLDKTRAAGSLIAPPMSESLCVAEDEVYVLFESAAEYYRQPSNPSRSPMDRVFVLKGF